jgi:hypothetical protein
MQSSASLCPYRRGGEGLGAEEWGGGLRGVRVYLYACMLTCGVSVLAKAPFIHAQTRRLCLVRPIQLAYTHHCG